MSITDRTASETAAAEDRVTATGSLVRSLDTGPAFWLAMFAASALGTNLGDWWIDDLEMDGAAGFLILSALCLAAIGLDRRTGRGGEAWYWVAIVALRALATNIADATRHALGIGFLVPAIVLGAAALAAGWFTRPAETRVGSPVIDGAYWTAMLIAGVFGTVGGDWGSSRLGLGVAAVVLVLLLLIVLRVRMQRFPAAMMAYWVAVLTERCAATPVGDWLASRRGLALGLPLAMACTGSLFTAALLWRHRRKRGFRQALT